MMRYQIKKMRKQSKFVSRRGFTLIEMLVALAVFMLLLVIILVPLNMGFTMLHLGKAQADVQTATQGVITQMRGDLSRAVYVYPNDVLPSVTGTTTNPKAPYGDAASALAGISTAPYFNGDPCTPATAREKNLARLDMILPETQNGSLLAPVLPTFYVVTYYARRWDITKPYQPIDNPIILYRAQVPFRSENNTRQRFSMLSSSGTDIQDVTPDTYPPAVISDPSQAFNANIYDSRYTNLTNPTACTAGSAASRSAQWLTQSLDGEPNLQPLTTLSGTSALNSENVSTLYGSHTAMLPVGIGMATGFNYKGYNALNQPIINTYYPPKSTFICADTNKDGIIDQVTVSLNLEKVDTGGAQPSGQRIGLPQVVELPNVRQLTDVR